MLVYRYSSRYCAFRRSARGAPPPVTVVSRTTRLAKKQSGGIRPRPPRNGRRRSPAVVLLKVCRLRHPDAGGKPWILQNPDPTRPGTCPGLTDDASRDFGDFDPIFEIGARLSYDLIDRAVSPYIGVHYEFATGESGRRAQAGGGKKDEFFFVAGARMIF